MRILVRALFIVVPWILFILAIGAIFEPRNANEWVFAGHWLLVPFVPIYLVVVLIGFYRTRPPIESSFMKKLKEKRGP